MSCALDDEPFALCYSGGDCWMSLQNGNAVGGCRKGGL